MNGTAIRQHPEGFVGMGCPYCNHVDLRERLEIDVLVAKFGVDTADIEMVFEPNPFSDPSLDHGTKVTFAQYLLFC